MLKEVSGNSLFLMRNSNLNGCVNVYTRIHTPNRRAADTVQLLFPDLISVVKRLGRNQTRQRRRRRSKIQNLSDCLTLRESQQRGN